MIYNYFTLKTVSMVSALKFKALQYKISEVIHGDVAVPLSGGLSISRGHSYIEVFLLVKVPRDADVDPAGFGIESDLKAIIEAVKNPNSVDGDKVTIVDFDGVSHDAYFSPGRMSGEPMTTLLGGVSSRMFYQIVLLMES